MKKAIIIGAGPAGLTAAYQFLMETDIQPVIIEMESFVGGISRTVEFEGNRMDIGGHRFFSKNEAVMRIWQKLLPLQGAASMNDKEIARSLSLSEAGPDPARCDKVLLVRNRVSRILYLRKFFAYPISLSPRTIFHLGVVNTIRAGIGYIRAACCKRKENTLEDFLINRFGKPLYQMFFCDYTEKVWGRPPKHISAAWGAQRIKGLSLRKTILHFFAKSLRAGGDANTETSLIERYYYPKFGPGQLWETMRQEIEQLGGEFLFSTKVVGLTLDSGRIVSVTVEGNGKTQILTGDYILSTMPISDLIAAMGNQLTSEMVKKTAAALPYRDFITVGLLVSELKIKNAAKQKLRSALVPDCWIYVQEKDVKLGRIQIFNNWSPYMVQDPNHTVWLGLEYFCDKGDALWVMEEKDFINFAIDELVMLDLIDRSSVQKSVRIQVEKAYPAYFGSYKDFSCIQTYLNTIENLYCIGRNGQHRYNNMDHSMLSAMTAVEAIASGTASKQDVWNINAEKSYHEGKNTDEGRAAD